MKRSLFVLLLLSLPLFFLKTNDTHEWGDDFSQYIKEAQNIANGIPYYRSGYIYNEQNVDYAPPQYPPGYPLIMAPVVRFFGIAIMPLMYLNSILMTGLLFALFFYFRKYASDVVAVCVALIATYGMNMIQMKQQVLSDLPATLFATLYLALRGRQWHRSVWYAVAVILLALMSILCRTQLAIILVAEAVWLLVGCIGAVKKKSFSLKLVYRSVSFKVIVGVSVLYFLLFSTVFASPLSTTGFYNTLLNNRNEELWNLIGYNINYLLEVFTTNFHFHTNDPFWQAPVTVMEYAGVVFMISGFIVSARSGLRVDDVYFILMCCLMLVLPVHQGYRYLMPLLPVCYYYCYRGGRSFLPQVFPFSGKALAITITLFYGVLGYDAFHSSLGAAHIEWTPNTAADSFAFSWVKNNIADSDIVIFTKPRLLTLYTGKRTMVLAYAKDDETNFRKLKQLNAKYILVRKDLDDKYYRPFAKRCPMVRDSVQIDSVYTIFKMN